MDQRGSGESAPALFGLHEAAGNPAQFLIDPRRKDIERGAVAFRPVPQEPGGFGLVEVAHGKVRNGYSSNAKSAARLPGYGGILRNRGKALHASGRVQYHV